MCVCVCVCVCLNVSVCVCVCVRVCEKESVQGESVGTGLLTESIASVTLDVPLSLIPSYLSDGVGYLLGSLRKERERASAFKVRLTGRGTQSRSQAPLPRGLAPRLPSHEASLPGSPPTRPRSQAPLPCMETVKRRANPSTCARPCLYFFHSWEGSLGTRPRGRGAWEHG